ncbi:MAG: hypothetical protein Q8918_00840 [Bacteroidota bacterium]|nr:hypothetical protein [Bacteroidota bacterium]MDP4211406.1 hypothetical protein [Bacteroidota bacterium]MDP4248633.1 hypothetical protein [Bacteroidota bacterium]
MMESLQQESGVTEIVRSGKKIISPKPVAELTSAKKLQIRDCVSWSICFGIICLLTGALLLYKIGITMSGVTSLLFYFSLAGLIFFVSKAFRLFSSHEVDRNIRPTNLN